MEYQTLSTGNSDTYLSPTGAVRDSQTGKPRYDLVHPLFMKRLAELLARGAVKYSERNWEKGQETGRTLASLLRHVYAYMEAAELGDGGDGEDHLAAIAFNAMSLMVAEDGILHGRLPLDLQTVPARVEHFKWEVSEQNTASQETVASAMEKLGEELSNTYASIWRSFFNPVRTATVADFEEANRRAMVAAEQPAAVSFVDLTAPVCCISPSDCTCSDDAEPEATSKENADWYLYVRGWKNPSRWPKIADAFPYTQTELMKVRVAPYSYYFRQDHTSYIYVPIRLEMVDGKVRAVEDCDCAACTFVNRYLAGRASQIDSSNYSNTESIVVSYPLPVTPGGEAFKTKVFTDNDREVWELFRRQNLILGNRVAQ